MGMGMGGSPMGNMTWQLTQHADGTFTGTVGFSGYRGGGQMLVSGTMTGRTGTFTITMPNGTMPMAGCSGQASGTFDMDELMLTMHGNWPDRFKCIVNHAGIFDARSMYYTTEELWFDEWEHGGPYYEKPANYEQFNPSALVRSGARRCW